jgi:hypothetical protein
MADEFEGVPREEWWQIRDGLRTYSWLFWLLAGLLGLLILRLIDKGVLAGWSDLLHPAAPASG